MKTALTALAMCAFWSFGQSVPEAHATATISDSYCVTIDATQPLQDYYEINIAHLGFADAEAAETKFGFIQNNLVTYYVDFANSKVIMELHLDRTYDPKDAAWWSEYLTSLCGL